MIFVDTFRTMPGPWMRGCVCILERSRLLALFFKREVVALGELHQPREPFTDVTPEVSQSAKTLNR